MPRPSIGKAEPKLIKLAVEVVENARQPIGVHDVAAKLGISWPAAKSLLLSLAINHEIGAIQTGDGAFLFMPADKGVLAK